MYYFQFRIILSGMEFGFFFRIFISETQKYLPNLFSGMHYFQFWIFISGIKGIFGIFEIMLGADSKVLGAGSICQNRGGAGSKSPNLTHGQLTCGRPG